MPGEIAVSGICDYDFETRRSHIEIYLSTNSSTKKVEITDNLIRDITCTVVHEVTHREQQKLKSSRAYLRSSSDELEYLMLPDEIDAYANDIAFDLYLQGLGLEYLREFHHDDSNNYSLSMYAAHLRETKELKRLYRKIYLNLIYLNS